MSSSCVVPPVDLAGAAPLMAVASRAICAFTLSGWLLASPLLAAGESNVALPAGVAGVAGAGGVTGAAGAAGVAGVGGVAGVAGVAAPGAPGALLGDDGEFAERLAAIRLDLTVDRDLEAADAALLALLVDVSAAAPFDGAVDLLVEVQLSRAELELQRGRPERAQAVLCGEQAPAGRSPETWQAVLADPRVIALHGRVEQQLARGTSSLDDQFLEVVRTALAERDEKVLEDLGTRAVPYLLALLEPGAPVAPDPSNDPLRWLAELDPTAFEREARALVESGELVNLERLLWALSRLDWKGDAYVLAPGRPPRLRSEERAVLLEAVFGEAELLAQDPVRGALRQLWTRVIDWDALPVAAAESAGLMCLGLPDGTVRFLASQSASARRECLVPFFELLLRHPADAVRAQAAERLAQWPPSATVLASVDDPSPRVRLELARSLTSRQVKVPNYHSNGVGQSDQRVDPILGPAEFAVLATLAADSDAAVRHMAATALVEPVARDGVADEVYLSLARDPEVTVRQLMTGFRHPDPGLTRELLALLATDEDALVRVAVIEREDLERGLLTELLATLVRDDEALVREAAVRRLAAQEPATLGGALVRGLADDPDPRVRAALTRLHHTDRAVERDVLARLARDTVGSVLAALDERLFESLGSSEWEADPDAWIALVEARRDHPTRPLVVGGRPLARDRLPKEFLVHPAGIVASTRWALASGDPGDWTMARYEMRSSSNRAGTSYESRYQEAFALLDDDELKGALAFYQRESLEGDEWLLEYLVEHPQERGALLRTLWEDAQQSLGVHVMAAAGLVTADPELGAELVDGLLTLLAHRGPDAPAATRLEGNGLYTLFTRLPPADGVRLILDAMAMNTLDADMASSIAYGVSWVSDPSCVRAVLERFADQPHDSRVLGRALESLKEHPYAMPAGWLEAFIRDPELPYTLCAQALDVLGARRDPADVPFLADVVRADWQMSGSARGAIVGAARHALVAQLSTEAAEALLTAAAAAPTGSERTLLMDGVRAIQEYQDARALWERRLATGATREDSIAALVRLTGQGSSDQRVQAVRGLATLRAVDQLPLLIELLADDDAAVVAAARAALDALHSEPVSATDG